MSFPVQGQVLFNLIAVKCQGPMNYFEIFISFQVIQTLGIHKSNVCQVGPSLVLGPLFKTNDLVCL